MVESSLDFIKSLADGSNVRTLSLAELDQAARPFGRTTRNRSAGRTVVFGSHGVASAGLSEPQRAMRESKDDTLRGFRAYLERAPAVRVQRTIGDNSSRNPKCTLLMSGQRADSIRQDHLRSRNLGNHDPSAPGPDLVQVRIPEWPENDRHLGQRLCGRTQDGIPAHGNV